MKRSWSTTFINIILTLIFGWKWKWSRHTFIDIVWTLKWDWLFKVNFYFLKFYQDYQVSRKMFLLLTHIKRCFNVNVNVDLTLTRWSRFNVDVMLNELATLFHYTLLQDSINLHNYNSLFIQRKAAALQKKSNLQ